MSLASDMKAHSAGFDLSVTAEGTLDDVSLKSEGKYAQAWEDKLETGVEAEDVACYEIGGDEKTASGFLFDLRPISELLGPLLIPYRPTEDLGGRAPWVWGEVRRSLEEYLDSLGVGQPMSDDLKVEYTPRTVRVSVGRPGWKADSTPWKPNELFLVGSIAVDAADVTDVQTKLMQDAP